MKPSHPLLSNNPLLGLQNQVNATKEHTNTPGLNLPGLSTQALTQAQAQLAQVQVIFLLKIMAMIQLKYFRPKHKRHTWHVNIF